ncbi:hypothetical protein ASPWEDRAFT_44385 [Aspergillus wentii DTO 134E9]|uniref:Rad4 beta-hairpin domain-containing protein n=1 Tax=Aspergillus wentii DTO 134E9 TaxID=1073089 RepID=A0A1L9RBN3_ASPWE|nr:uncharacterized protein ASPWEDRAFT_44385 [Aspergillus wentii DTO 134E9]OJJ32298.1 hypothetical protein ASPWEDRAFT_44385 [Aspergillus wentii DTO 134E9]
MPPFVPRKRVSSEDPPSAKRQALQNATVIQNTDSESSLSDAPSSDDENDKNETTSKNNDKDEDEEDGSEDESVDWEDAIETKTPYTTTPLTPAFEAQDLELTLDKNEVHMADLLDGKKGPSKIERQIRIQTHCMHVQFLLFHNAVRNAWANDSKVHDILREKLPAGIQKEVKKWRIASGLEAPEEKPEEKKKKKGKGKQSQKQNRDWGEGSSRLEPGQPDMSRGDPIITLLKVLAAYWKKQFKITAPGLRKHGYRPMSQLEAEISSFNKDDPNPERHGEKFANVDEFRAAAEHMEGSRDVGAQLFTALLRALAIETRLVASLQPLGFGWTKSETYTASKPKADAETNTDLPDIAEEPEPESENSDSDENLSGPNKNSKSSKGYDKDLPFPIYWAEVASPITHEIIPVDPLVLPNAVATTPELQAAFEPRGAKAEKAKQVICYVIAYNQDRTAKDVTTRYLRRRTWPGKTKGYRMPVEKIPLGHRKGKFYEYDWFRVTFRVYERPEKQRTMVDDIEDVKDLQANQPDKKPAKEGDTLQSLRSSTEFVLERFLRREEALRPGARHVRTFVSGKGPKAKEEKVYRRADILKCMSSESWHKEGRQIKTGEAALKHVPIRAVTLLRKREVDELERATGEKPKQGLYAKHQTEYIIPPPIRNGVIPKNDYGNIDCFVPSMVPQGAVHIPWPYTVRICKKLGIDYAEAVTGFEFGSKMAVPVIEGVVVAAENKDLVKDAWRAEDAEKRKKEQLKAEKRILQTWRKFLFGLRIAERVREEYGDRDTERDEHNPFTNRQSNRNQSPPPQEDQRESSEDPADRGGGFLLPGEDDGDDGDLIVERHQPIQPPPSEPQIHSVDDDEDEDEVSNSSSIEEIPPPSPSEPEDDPASVSDYAPPRRRPTRRTRGRGKY